MVNLMGDLLKTVLFMEIMVMGDGWIISVQEDWHQSVNQHTTTYDLSFKIKALVFVLSHFSEECFYIIKAKFTHLI